MMDHTIIKPRLTYQKNHKKYVLISVRHFLKTFIHS